VIAVTVGGLRTLDQRRFTLDGCDDGVQFRQATATYRPKGKTKTMATIMIRVSAIILVFGMLAGIAMGITQDFALAPAHAHLNLVGGVLLFLFGLYYKLVPHAAEGTLPKVQGWLHIVGSFAFPIGIAVVLIKGPALEIFPIVGSLIVLVASILFVIVTFRSAAA
jgi:hypothetical protein